MKRDWQPGDVGLLGDRVALRADGSCDTCRQLSGYTSGDHRHDAFRRVGNGADQTVRPLVVIDPEDRDQAIRLRDALTQHANPCNEVNVQAALRSLIAPPKPAEPTGLGAVVEVDSLRFDGKARLVRTHATHDPWYGDSVKRTWSEIDGPVTVLSEGVQ